MLKNHHSRRRPHYEQDLSSTKKSSRMLLCIIKCTCSHHRQERRKKMKKYSFFSPILTPFFLFHLLSFAMKRRRNSFHNFPSWFQIPDYAQWANINHNKQHKLSQRFFHSFSVHWTIEIFSIIIFSSLKCFEISQLKSSVMRGCSSTVKYARSVFIQLLQRSFSKRINHIVFIKLSNSFYYIETKPVVLKL